LKFKKFRHHELKEQLKEQQKRFADSEKLDALSRKMCGEGVGGALSSLRSKWDSLDVLMESHQEVIKGQVSLNFSLYFLFLLRERDYGGGATRPLPRDGSLEELHGDPTVGPRPKVWTRG